MSLWSPDGTVARTAYDALGRAEWATDSFVPGTPTRGTRTVYDGQGRVAATERYADVVVDVVTVAGFPRAVFVGSAPTPLSTSATAFDGLGRVTQSTGTGVATSKSYYDRAGRVTRAESLDPANGNAVLTWSETAYDAAGRVLSTTDARGAVTWYQYDADGRPTRVTLADGASAQTGYDGRGRKASEVDAVGQRTDYGYDALGRLTDVRQPAVPNPLNSNVPERPRTQYGYDSYGNRRTVTDARGRVTAFAFDAFGRQTGRTLPAVTGDPAAVETTVYDAFGSPDYAVDFKGQKTDWVYDYDVAGDTDLGRLRRVDYYPAGAGTPAETVTYAYDTEGRQTTVTEAASGQADRLTHTTYDTDGRVVRVSGPEVGAVINYRYEDATGRLVGMWTGGGAWGTGPTQVEYGYDRLGRLAVVRELRRADAALSPAVETAYVYDAAGAVDSVTVTRGATPVRYTDYQYSPLRGWLTRVENKVSPGGAVLSTFDYTRRADGQVTQVVESVAQPTGGPAATTVSYTYDALNRLVMEVSDRPGTAEDSSIQYALDLVGNRLTKTAIGGGFTDITTGTFDARDRLTAEAVTRNGAPFDTITSGYDANGSLTTRSGTASGPAAYTWDVRGRLAGATVGASTTAYRYTPGGIRSQVTVGGTVVRYVVDGMSPSGYAQAIEEWTTGSGGAPVLLAATVYGAGLDPLSAVRDLDGAAGLEVAYLVADAHGGVRQLVAAASVVTAAYRYDAYGANAVAPVGVWALANPNRYRGERLDPTLAQYYLRARLYDPASGRFTTVDPFAGTYADPLQLMRYGYAGANPIAKGDPSGLFSVTSTLSSVGGIQGVITASTGVITWAYRLYNIYKSVDRIFQVLRLARYLPLLR